MIPTRTVSAEYASIPPSVRGCGLCVVLCPAGVLYMSGSGEDRKARVLDEWRGCIGCNDCSAACDAAAIIADQGYDSGGRYKQLFRGEFTPPRRF